MKLIAQKPCCFGGKQFFIGEEIPEEFVLDPKAQEMMGTLVIVTNGTETKSVETVSVTLHSKQGDMPLTVSSDGIQSIFDALTGDVEYAKKTVKEMTDEDALILLHAAESRKSVQAAAEARANELSEGGQ